MSTNNASTGDIPNPPGPIAADQTTAPQVFTAAAITDRLLPKSGKLWTGLRLFALLDVQIHEVDFDSRKVSPNWHNLASRGVQPSRRPPVSIFWSAKDKLWTCYVPGAHTCITCKPDTASGPTADGKLPGEDLGWLCDVWARLCIAEVRTRSYCLFAFWEPGHFGASAIWGRMIGPPGADLELRLCSKAWDVTVNPWKISFLSEKEAKPRLSIHVSKPVELAQCLEPVGDQTGLIKWHLSAIALEKGIAADDLVMMEAIHTLFCGLRDAFKIDPQFTLNRFVRALLRLGTANEATPQFPKYCEWLTCRNWLVAQLGSNILKASLRMIERIIRIAKSDLDILSGIIGMYDDFLSQWDSVRRGADAGKRDVDVFCPHPLKTIISFPHGAQAGGSPISYTITNREFLTQTSFQ